MNECAVITVRPTRDWRVLDRVLNAPEIRDRVLDDSLSGEPPEAISKAVHHFVAQPENLVLTVHRGDELCGCFMFAGIGNKTLEVHTMMLASLRGRDAIIAGKIAMRKAFQLTGAAKLVSMCPTNMRESHWFALRCGMKDTGTSDKHWIKNGKTYEMKTVEVSREDVCRLAH